MEGRVSAKAPVAITLAPYGSTDDNLQKAAQLMRDRDIGALPVYDGTKLMGMITDRDISIRATAAGKMASDVKVSEVMSDQVLWCFEDQTVGEVLQQMGDQQIRRIPGVNRNMELTGVVALADLATRQTAQIDSALEEISSPVPAQRPSTGKQPSTH